MNPSCIKLGFVLSLFGAIAFIACVYFYVTMPDKEKANDSVICYEYKFEEDFMIDIANEICTYNESNLCKKMIKLSETAYNNMAKILRKYNIDDCESIILG